MVLIARAIGAELRKGRMIDGQKRRKHVRLVPKFSELFLQYNDVVSFDRDCSQNARSPRAGVNVDAIAVELGMLHRSVAVNHNLPVIRVRLKKIVSYPVQVFGILLIERNAGANPGMNKQEVSAHKAVTQTLQKQFVSARKHIEERLLQGMWRDRIAARG